MPIREFMSTNVESVRPDSTLREAASRMAEGDFGAMPVYDGKELKGMITDRDICIRAVAEGRDPDEVRVQDIMSEQVLTCYEDQDTDDVIRMMQDRQVRRIPIIDRSENLVGIVSLGDLAVMSSDRIDVANTLDEISQPVQH